MIPALNCCFEIQISEECLEIEGIVKFQKVHIWQGTEYPQGEVIFSYGLLHFSIVPIAERINRMISENTKKFNSKAVNISISATDMFSLQQEIRLNSGIEYQSCFRSFLSMVLECSKTWSIVFQPECEQIDSVQVMSIDQSIEWIIRNIDAKTNSGLEGIIILSD